MKLRNFLLLLMSAILSFGSMDVQAQEAEDSAKIHNYTVEQAVSYALKNNQTVRNAKLDAQIAQKTVWETTAIGLPQVNAEVNYSNMLDLATQLIPSEFFGGPPGSFAEVQFGTQHNADWNVSVSQLIFSGEYFVGLKAAHTYLELSKNSLEKKQIDATEAVTSAYYSVLVTRQSLGILDSTLANMKLIVDEQKALQQQGFLEETDVDQMRLNVLNLQNRKQSMQKLEEIMLHALYLQMSMPTDHQLQLSDNLNQVIANVNFEQAAQTDFNATNTVDYKIVRTQEDMQYLTMRREQSLTLPSIGAFYSYSKNAMRDEFNFFETGDDYKWFPTSVVGVRVSIPIFSSGTRWARIQKAKMELDKAVNTRMQVEQSLQLNYKQTRSDLLTALETYEIEKQNMELSKRIYDKTIIKYRQGVSSSLDVTQAQNQYLSAQSNYFNSLLELLNAKVKLDKLTNNL